MFAETAAAISSLKAASDIARAMVDVRDATKLSAQIGELQQAIIAAQVHAIAIAEKNFALSNRVQELESECKRLTDWSVEAQNYEVKEISTGVFAYLAKGDATSLQSAQKLCPNCFAKRAKSLLQQSNDDYRSVGLTCPACRMKLVFHGYQ
jgi:hypothetical protein